MRFLLVDHNDSFTWNVYHLMKQSGMGSVTVTRPCEMTLSQVLTFDHFVFSPGPGRPEEYPWSIELIRTLDEHQGFFGICLGMQSLCLAHGGSLTGLKQVQHGIRVAIEPERNKAMFEDTSRTIRVGRYHSWIPVVNGMSDHLERLASDKNGHVMAVAHKLLPQWGVQFHPESIMTPEGIVMMKTFYTMCTHLDSAINSNS